MIRAATHDEIRRISEHMEYAAGRDTRGVVLLEEATVAACVLYDYWTYNAVQVHVYAPSLKALFSPPFLRAIFSYPFFEAKRNILYAVTPGDAKGSLAVSGWLGFKEKYRIKDGWKPGIDMILKELRREHCRFIPQDVKCAS